MTIKINSLTKAGFVLTMTAVIGGQMFAATPKINTDSFLEPETEATATEATATEALTVNKLAAALSWTKDKATSAKDGAVKPFKKGWAYVAADNHLWNKYPKTSAAIITVLATYSMMKFYEYLKVKTALNKASEDTTLNKAYAELQTLNIKLDDPNLVNRAEIEARRKVVIASIVAEHYKDTSAMNEILEVVSTLNPLA